MTAKKPVAAKSKDSVKDPKPKTATAAGKPAPVKPQVKAGKVRALALNGTNRLPALPDVPTLVECGIPFELVGWHAMFAPAGTPREIVERLNRVVNQVIAMPDVRTRIFEAGSFPVQPPTSVEQWGSMFRQDVQNWAELVRASGATIN